MRSSGFIVAIALITMAWAGMANGSLIGYWHFNDGNLTVDEGAGTLTLSPNMVLNTNYAFFSGDTLNARPSIVAGDALVVAPSNTEGLGNGVTWTQFEVNTSAYEDLIMTFATYRNTTDSFNSVQVLYSTDGSSFTNFGSPYNPAGTAFELKTFDFSSIPALDNDASVYVRLTFSGATSFGLSRRHGIDNVQFNATEVPEPAALGLVGAMALLAVRRRLAR